MSQIKSKFIEDAAVTSNKIQTSVALAGSPTTTTQAAADNSTKIATTAYIATAISNAAPSYVAASSVNAANGVCPLDATSKVPSANLPAYVDDVLEYANQAALPATGVAGIIYVTLDTNLTYRWGGSSYILISSGAVQSVNGATGAVVLTTTSINEGTNLYYTNARAQAATVAQTITSGVTTSAPSQDAVFTALAGKQATLNFLKESKTLVAGDITSQFVDLAQVAKSGSIHLQVRYGIQQVEGLDYTVLLTGGVGGKTRVTFAGDLATGGVAALVAADILYIQYAY